MGATQAEGIAEAVSEGLATLEQAIAFHLTSNHYPPVPLSMVPVCIAAIEAYNDDYHMTARAPRDVHDHQILLPEGVTWRGQESAPVYAILEDFHLGAFLATDEPEYEEE